MYDNYYDACEATVSRSEALQELYRHGIDAAGTVLFFDEVGSKAEYTGAEVLNWLGY